MISSDARTARERLLAAASELIDTLAQQGITQFSSHEEAEQLDAVIERVVASGFGGKRVRRRPRRTRPGRSLSSAKPRKRGRALRRHFARRGSRCSGAQRSLGGGTDEPKLHMQTGDLVGLLARPPFGDKRGPTRVSGRLQATIGRPTPTPSALRCRRPRQAAGPCLSCPVWIVPLPRSVRSLLRSGRCAARDPLADQAQVRLRAGVKAMSKHRLGGEL